MWSHVDPARIQQTWMAALGRLLALLVGAQRAVAGQADRYLDEILDAQDIDPTRQARLDPAALSGIASDGRDLRTLLYQPVVTTLTGIQRGASQERAFAGGQATLDMIVRTQVADAGRGADQVALTARRQATGYVRMLVGKSCSRCAILAGRRYAWNAGFRRHPRCLPAGVAVSGPAVDAATRRWYQGEMVVLTTASGQELPITGNHPVLTSRGWVPAHLLQEGDDVVRSTRAQGAAALTVPGEDQVPTLIEDLWRPDGVMPLLHVPTATEDFHGDGGHGEVDVVLADRLLRHGLYATLVQFTQQEQFARGIAGAAIFAQLGSGDEKLRRLAPATIRSDIRWALDDAGPFRRITAELLVVPRRVCGGGLGAPLVGSLTPSAQLSRFGHTPDLDAGFDKAPAYGTSGDTESSAEVVFALSSLVGRSQSGDVERSLSARWDAPAGPLTVESRGAYAERGQDLLLRLSGQVELDRIVKLGRVEWSGHVYNLSSSEGWYSANGLIVSNCDCIHIPAREDSANDLMTNPRRFFESLPAAEQDRVFTRAGAEAIRNGADIGQVVNARRGMQTASVFGRDVLVTTEGTTVRGQAGRRLGAREEGRRRDGARYRSATRIRLMPEQILAEAAGNRDEAIRLLKVHGYLI